ncbi:MAG TPA: ferredoxin [Verrucomicrobiota bacterium]|nr:ferredoxin [Verrucomicrobiales bacterium]HRI11856.1 ferredoxin [Verrucomicrobiota bacterium]
MALPNLRLAENAPGPYYVTSECIDCDICRETAAGIFRRHDDLGFSVVIRQPATDTEHQLAKEALEGCPVEAIGREADSPSS